MTYKKLPGLTWDGTIYENEEMGTLEALLPTGGYPTAHAPAMVELPDGTLLGDVAAEAAGTVAACTPVPGGIGSVTTALLLLHTVQSAEIFRQF